MKMIIDVKQLTPDLLDDWLQFFDNIGFSDNEHWSGCYCMCNHWDKKYKEQYNWELEVKKGIDSISREIAINLIKNFEMQGYLAYNNDLVVGWCNVNDKNVYKPIHGDLPWDDSERNDKIKSIMCFCISPKFRNKGIASLILEKICKDASIENYKYIEAYPFIKEEWTKYTGPLNMYKKNGFIEYRKDENIQIMRKYL